MRLFGCARVSTSQQSLDAQINTLNEAGLVKSKVFTDKNTGSQVKRDSLSLLEVNINNPPHLNPRLLPIAD